MRRVHSRRTLAGSLALVGVAGVLAGCSAESQLNEDVQSAVLLTQAAFPNGGNVAECPEVAEDAPKDTQGGVARAVCITVENTGDGRATFTVPVTVQNRDDDPLVLSQVTLTTQPIEPGAEGAVAIAAPGTEKVIDEYADGQEDQQKAAGFILIDDIGLKIGDVVRTPA